MLGRCFKLYTGGLYLKMAWSTGQETPDASQVLGQDMAPSNAVSDQSSAL